MGKKLFFVVISVIVIGGLAIAYMKRKRKLAEISNAQPYYEEETAWEQEQGIDSHLQDMMLQED